MVRSKTKDIHEKKKDVGIKVSRKKRKSNPSTETTKTSNKGDASSDGPSETWSKSKKKRMRAMKAKQLKKQQQQSLEKKTSNSSNHPADEISLSEKESGTVSKLQDAFKARLSGSRFRILNEELYTKESKKSFGQFSANPELFEQYHEGFRKQAAQWPVNPVNTIVRWISASYRNQPNTLIADFGCGDAQLAKDLINMKNKKGANSSFKVHSFDLVSNNELVTACDMANVPLENKSVDVVVFCLALMGTNLADFIREAHRVLKDNGRVKIAEVRSRIEYSYSSKGKQKQDGGNTDSLSGTLEEFVQVLTKLGFECSRTDRSNKMFLFLELKKNGKVPNKKLEFSAKPCIYKRR
jgi:ribosomal RNA-processing protein 8